MSNINRFWIEKENDVIIELMSLLQTKASAILILSSLKDFDEKGNAYVLNNVITKLGQLIEN